MKVGYLGPKGTFSYEACKNSYEENIEKTPYKTIRETILALEKNEIDEAIVPIENSLQGCVTEAIDTLIENEYIKVTGEHILKINQNLMAKENYKLEEIKEIYFSTMQKLYSRKLKKRKYNRSIKYSIISKRSIPKKIRSLYM